MKKTIFGIWQVSMFVLWVVAYIKKVPAIDRIAISAPLFLSTFIELKEDKE